jgi:VanZ family protein
MRIFFSILSIAYIAGIFLFADSSVVSTLAAFNPYSLLHIPLYGILTVLLIFSFVPLKFKLLNSINPRNSINAINAINFRARYLLPGGIALIVAIADEIHQAYVPGRDASITDVLLDLVGIILVLFFFFRLLKTKPSLIH